MTEESRELSHALFTQERAYIKHQLGDESWIKVYDYSQNPQNTNFFYSGLIPNECVTESLQNTNWEVDINSGFPCCVRFGDGTVEYSRFGSVEDSYLRCGVSWGIRIDNNHENVVIVYLGDLGRDLPVKERIYWKVFNIPPKGSLSTTKYMRDFLGIPFDPQGRDLNFKQRYQQLNQKWKAKYGWSLFRELSSGDFHFFQNLRVPLNNGQSEFDLQILTLAKVLIDALNENEIEKNISSIPDPPRGIAKFSVFLEEKNFVDCQEGLALLRDIQSIRSTGVAHLKGSNYSKLVKKLQLSEKELQRVFCDLLDRSATFLEKLSSDIDRQSTV